MKSYLVFICLCIAIVACQNDQNANPDPKPTSLPNLTLSSALQLLPVNTLKEGQVAIFVNESGEELPLNLKFENGTIERNFDGIKYQSEYISVEYNEDKVGSHFFPSIRTNDEYSGFESSEEVLTVTLLTSYNEGFIPNIVLKDNKDPMFGNYVESITIANHTFNKVFTNTFSPPNFDSFTKLYYTVEQGIVGFEGEQREMWALDRIE